jgi:hypothetical protein
VVDSPPECFGCRKPIEPPDEPVVVARQVEVTPVNAEIRQFQDGLVEVFHEWCAPPSTVGVWRRVSP